MTTATYEQFLARKAQLEGGHGTDPAVLPDWLHGFQAELTGWAVRQGRAAIFADCGMGKTPMQLVWADNVRRIIGRPVLIVTPLAVAAQTVREADRFDIDAAQARDGSIPAPITVVNYEQLHRYRPADFAGVVLDESSAIKAMDGKRRAEVTEFARTLPWRLAATATAAPNDWMELGTTSEALGYLGQTDMLTRFFTRRQRVLEHGSDWRIKGHATVPFWRWVASWSRACRRPSDLGFADDGFVLPPLEVRRHVASAADPDPERLFDVPATGLAEERAEQRRTLQERCETAASLLDGADPGVAWCHRNDEADLLTRLIDGAVQVAGSDPAEAKEETFAAFAAGDIRVLVTKPSIGAFGLNWQHCRRMTYFPSHSYEQYYQAVRRCWRYGQTSPVTVDVVTTVGGLRALESIERKAQQADEMFAALVQHMSDAWHIERDTAHTVTPEVPAWVS